MKLKVVYPFTFILLLVIVWFILLLKLRNVNHKQNILEMPVMNGNYFNKEYSIILHIQQPLSDFHSDHWFHMSEYFLSHMNEIQRMYSSKDYVNKVPISLHIIGNTPLFSNKLSKMSLFLLIMTISNYKNLEQIVSDVYIHDSFYNCNSHSTTRHCYDTYKNTETENKSCYLIEAPLKMHGIVDFSMQYMSYKYQIPEIDQSNRVVCDPLHISLGHKPIPTSKWFLDQDSATLFRRKLNEICPIDSINSKKFKLVLFNRNLDRIFLNFNDAIEAIVAGLPLHIRNNWEIIHITHDESREPCELKKIIHTADVFITSHGFQCTSLLFMKEDALLFEIFPYKYFRTTYLDLSSTFGIQHKWIQIQQPSSISRNILRFVSQDMCMNSGYCRHFARKDNIYLTPNEINAIINTIVTYNQEKELK